MLEAQLCRDAPRPREPFTLRSRRCQRLTGSSSPFAFPCPFLGSPSRALFEERVMVPAERRRLRGHGGDGGCAAPGGCGPGNARNTGHTVQSPRLGARPPPRQLWLPLTLLVLFLI